MSILLAGEVELVTILCGDRNWIDPATIVAVMKEFPAEGRTVVITGGANGADNVSWHLAHLAGHRNMRLDAAWTVYGKRAGPARNQWMVELLLVLRTFYPAASAHVHAFHNNIAASKGTADLLSRARASGIPYTIHTGREEEEHEPGI